VYVHTGDNIIGQEKGAYQQKYNDVWPAEIMFKAQVYAKNYDLFVVVVLKLNADVKLIQ
jgi:hypothetical protein